MSRRTAMIVKASGNHPDGFGGRLNPEMAFLTEGVQNFWSVPSGPGFDVECFWTCKRLETTLLDGITMIMRSEIEHRARKEKRSDIADLLTQTAPPMMADLSEETYLEVGEFRNQTLTDWNGDLGIFFMAETDILNQLHELDTVPVDIQIFLPTDQKSTREIVKTQPFAVKDMGGQQ